MERGETKRIYVCACGGGLETWARDSVGWKGSKPRRTEKGRRKSGWDDFAVERDSNWDDGV